MMATGLIAQTNGVAPVRLLALQATKCLVARHAYMLSTTRQYSSASSPHDDAGTPILVQSRLVDKPYAAKRRISSMVSNNNGTSLSTGIVKSGIPQQVRDKIVSASDAVALVRDGDTIAVSGFVAQGSPEAVLQALGKRFERSASPANLTLLFGGGPGDWGERGLSHLAKIKKVGSEDLCMLRRTIGGHYGQVPKVAQLALDNQVEAWTLPMGSISRMIRSQSTHSPGHITNIGLGTYVDPDISGGCANEAAAKSDLKLVSKLDIEGQTHLMYKALPINVAIIRGTTADAQGNITLEQESLLCDQKITAAASKNSGGIVIAQVKRLAATGSFKSRDVGVPGALVDCVVVVDPKDHDDMHGMSYVERENPALTGRIVTPEEEIETMPLNVRKVIARRAAFGLKPNKIVNLGIGLPEGVASVAAEEGILKYVTLSTEPGVFGGLPASGHSFGPSYNASSLIEMNQMFDFYDGGGLDMSFLGAGQVSKTGDVNVSRMAKEVLTGPGGFIDISQATRNICFMSPFTAKGLEIETPGDGTLRIVKEGQIQKFVPEVMEKTFSGDEAVRRGQKVMYVTERAVFRKNAEGFELVEIADGIDLQRDVLDQMGFECKVSPNLIKMDPRIFKEEKMGARANMFGTLEDRCTYHEMDHVIYVDLSGVTLNTEEEIREFFDNLCNILDPLVEDRGKINAIINYHMFDLRIGIERLFGELAAKVAERYYKSVKRYTGAAFRRAVLKSELKIEEWNPNELFEAFDADHNGILTLEELRNGIRKTFDIMLTPSQLAQFQDAEGKCTITRENFEKGIQEILK